MKFDRHNAEGIEDYPNELAILAEADDVVGNGVFDPHGSHGNVHPDQGIFQDHQSIPGYMERDKFYTPSEVVDVTTGKPVMYVPGGAVAIDYAQKQAFENRLLWSLPPGVNPWRPNPVSTESTVTPRGAARPVHGWSPRGQVGPIPQANIGPQWAAVGRCDRCGPLVGPIPQQSTLPRYPEVVGPMHQSGLRGITDFLQSPVYGAAKALRPTGLRGVATGNVGVGIAVGVGLVVGAVVLGGFLSYKAGAAMAPNRGARKSWGWTAVPVGLLTGVYGLGTMGAVSLSKRS